MSFAHVPELADWTGEAHGRAVVRANLHIRTRPAEDAPSLGLWLQGDILDVWVRSGDWLFVMDATRCGWSHSDYLSPL